jgi:lipopolysaccharide export system protein LptC
MSVLEGRYLYYLLLAVMALLSWWLVKLTVIDPISQSEAIAHSPDYFSNGYTKWEMSKTGQLKSKLVADKMLRYKDDGTLHLTKPVMTFYNDETPPWVIRSETGIVSADGKTVYLNGKAVVDRAKAEGVKPLTINSSNLTVKPETSYAETTDWAELISLPQKTTGIGMKLTYAQPVHIALLAKVRGHYETKKK